MRNYRYVALRSHGIPNIRTDGIHPDNSVFRKTLSLEIYSLVIPLSVYYIKVMTSLLRSSIHYSYILFALNEIRKEYISSEKVCLNTVN